MSRVCYLFSAYVSVVVCVYPPRWVFSSGLIILIMLSYYHGHDTPTDFLFLDMRDFDVISSMDMLSFNSATFDYLCKIVTLDIPCIPLIVWQVFFSSTLVWFISLFHA